MIEEARVGIEGCLRIVFLFCLDTQFLHQNSLSFLY